MQGTEFEYLNSCLPLFLTSVERRTESVNTAVQNNVVLNSA